MIEYFKENKLKLASLIVASEAIINQLIRLVSNLILTRLLMPEMFGVMSIALVFLVGISMLSDIGLKEKYIQSQNSNKQEFIDSCWSLQVIRGIIIAFIVVFLALLLFIFSSNGFFNEQSVYANKQLPIIISILGLTSLISGFNSISIYEHSRNVNMMVLAKINLFPQFIATVLMVLSALFVREIWVLLIAPVVSTLLKLCLSYTYSYGIKASFKLNRDCVKEIYSFARWIFIGSSLTFLSMNADRIMLGGLLSSTEMGVYSIALLLSMALYDLFIKIVKNVAYPKLSEVARSNPSNLFKVQYNLRFKIDFCTFSAAGFLFGFGSIIVSILYDSRYHDAGWMLEILSLSLLFIGFNVSHLSLMSLGKAYSYAFVNFTTACYLLIALPVSYVYFGIEVAIFVIATKPLSSIILLFYLQKKNGLLSLFNELRMIPIFFISYFIGVYCKKVFEYYLSFY